MKIILSASHDVTIKRFRLSLIDALMARGHQIALVLWGSDYSLEEALGERDVEVVRVSDRHTELGVLVNFRAYLAYRAFLKKWQPDAVVAMGTKPIVMSGLPGVAFPGSSQLVILLEGLGQVFSERSGWRSSLIRQVVKRVFRRAFDRSEKTIFLNDADRRDLLQMGVLSAHTPFEQVAGIGVDLSRFQASPLPEAPPYRCLMISRLLEEKGVRDYVAAARVICRQRSDVEFLLLGETLGGKDEIPLSEVQGWQEEGVITWLSAREDVRPLFEQSHLYVLPSYYREGLPATLMEAAAMGRPSVTTDWVGCREAVVDHVTGRLIETRNVSSLVAAILGFIDDPEEMSASGVRARALAEDRFDRRAVDQLLVGVLERSLPEKR